MKQIIQKRKIYLTLSVIMIVLSLVFIATWKLNLGIDFTGGSLLEVRFNDQVPQTSEIKDTLLSLDLQGSLSVQATMDNGYIIRFQSIEEEFHQQMVLQLETTYNTEEFPNNVREQRFEAIGPSIGSELKTKAINSILIVLLCIVAYIAWAFRKVSYPVKSWKYGVVAILTLFHDLIITLGIFAILGRFWGVEVGLPFVAALLTILGYSVNDTIVVFDRIRENLARIGRTDFETLVNRSVNETITRSLNTSLTTFLVLIAVFIFGGVSIKYFVFALMCGVLLGTYSSIFVASPLLVIWEKKFQKK